jgi:WD40 repeat protein
MLKKSFFLLFLFVCLAPFSSVAATNQQAGNSGSVFAADANSQYLVVSSDGKSIDIFNLQSQKLLRTIKLPPLGTEEAGINALAINPESYIIAAGGWTHKGISKAGPIYLFDLEAARLFGRIPVLPAAVTKLIYSKDGNILAVGLAQKKGLHIYKMHELTISTVYNITELHNEEKIALQKFNNPEETLIIPNLLTIDKNYDGDITGLDFGNNGRLVVCSDDGMIRLYDNQFNLLKKSPTKNGAKPGSISFSPDNSMIAVSFTDTAAIDVISAADLAYLYSPDTKDFAGGSMSAVAWSADGQLLYSSGKYKGFGYSTICRWKDSGKASCGTLSNVNEPVKDLTALKGGGVFYTDSSSRINMLDKRFGTVANERGSIWVAADHKYGDVTYTIGGNYGDSNGDSGSIYFPISRLKWPVNAFFGEIGGEIHLGKRGELRGSLARNITNTLYGKVEDSDWLFDPSIYGNRADISSESESNLMVGYVADASVRYWFSERQYKDNKSYTLGAGVGFTYQNYSWEASHLDQWSSLSPDHIYYAGLVGTYKASIYMPYAELVIKSKISNFDLTGSIGGSPYTWASDEDYHLLRKKLMKTDAHGYAVKLGLEANYNFTRNWFAGLRFNLLYFYTEGTQKGVQYATAPSEPPVGYQWEIEHRIESVQLDTMLTVGFRF